ncbi:MAG: lysophospholipid acyltransferase family protein [Pseudomonadota bacterium]
MQETDGKVQSTGASDPDRIELPGQFRFGGSLRATFILLIFLTFTLACMPLQYILLRTSKTWARTFPYWYHRRVCQLIGIRHDISGQVARNKPVLIVANHVSWLDIPVLSAVAPLSFVAKSEVGTWPFVSWLARLQRTVFVNRSRRTEVGKVSDTIRGRLLSGDTLVLFAEGTSSDGNRVLPFKSALLSSVFPRSDEEDAQSIDVQTLAITYTHVHGIPLGRADRNLIGWYGDMEMGGHAWQLLSAGPIDVKIQIGEPIELATFKDRKQLAGVTEESIRHKVVAALRNTAS